MNVQVKDYLTPVQAVQTGTARDIPVIDLSDFRATTPGALEECAARLRDALENVGFYLIVNHGVPQATIDRAYDEMRRYDFYTRNGHKGFKTFVFDYYERMTTNPASVPVAYAPPVVQPPEEPALLPVPPIVAEAP